MHLLEKTFYLFRCFFDSVRGKMANLIFTTIPLPLVLMINMILYIATYKKIRDQVHSIEQTLGPVNTSHHAHLKAARAMSLFVIALVFQWWTVAVYGIYRLFTESDEDIPRILFHFATTFPNTGGILNLIIYGVIHKNKLGHHSQSRNHTTQHSQQ